MRRVGLGSVALLLALTTSAVSTQGRTLRVISASPNGELTDLADAGEVRVVFSEPMVQLGDAPVAEAPPWVSITPAIRGGYYWSGTRTLIFTPDPEAPVPYATRYRVRVDQSARSVTGLALPAPYDFTFTTPTVRLLSANWYRKSLRASDPIVVALRFNQPVDARDVAAHTRVQAMPHQWIQPSMRRDVRDRLSRVDPDGLARFDAKVAATARVAAGAGGSIALSPAAAWDEAQFGPAANLAVLESATVPAPESWLSITVDADMPSLQGPERHVAQSTTIRLEPAFFIRQMPCVTGCDPSTFKAINLERPVPRDALSRVLSIRDVSDSRAERPIVPGSTTLARSGAGSTFFQVQDFGFERQPPDSRWLYAIDASLTSVDGQTLGYPWMEVVENVHEQEFAAFDGAVWETAGGVSVPVVTRNVTSLRYWLAPFQAADGVLYRLQVLNRPASRGDVIPRVDEVNERLTVKPDAIESHGLSLSRVLTPRGTGLVWAALTPDAAIPRVYKPNYNVDRTRATLLQVTNLGLNVKDSPNSTLVFVTRLDTGAPVTDANVEIVAGGGETIWRGSTDRDGVALAPAVNPRPAQVFMNPSFVVTAEKAGDVAFVASNWNGPQPYAWQIPYSPAESTDILRGAIFTDRGVYRQGEEIHVKAILRVDSPTGVRLAPAGDYDVVVLDPRGREVDTRKAAVGEWSSAEWAWRVPANAALGTYRIAVRRPGTPANNARFAEARASFLVAQYRRPDFRVDATLSAGQPIVGLPIRGTIDAKYLFGAGIASQLVRWRLTRSAAQSVPDAITQRFPAERYAFGYLAPPEPNQPATVQLDTRTERLDTNGHLSVDAQPTRNVDAAYSYMFEGDVASDGGQHIANRATLVVHPSSLYVGVKRPPFFVDTKTGASLDVVAAALDGRPIAGVPVTVTLFRQEWQWIASPARWERKETAAGEWTVTTRDTAAAPLQVPVRESGSYVLRATAADSAGRRTRTDVAFYAFGTGRSSWKVDGNRIDLVPERKTWKPGESARILIQSPWERATALLTIEREGIRRHRTFNVTSMQDTIDVPLTEADVPNVYVSVVLVKGRTSDELGPDGSDLGKPAYRLGYTELTVDTLAKRLDVQVSTDRDEYRPGQSIDIDASVTSAGRPARGEITLWAVDYGLLSLTGYRTPDVVSAIYAHKSLGVMTEDNRERLISRRLVASSRSAAAGESVGQVNESAMVGQAGGFGGGGGGGRGGGGPSATPPPPPAALRADAAQEPALELRTDFRSLVFWLGSATTDATGHARTTVRLPDSLTTYRVMAVAADTTSHFGWGEREVKATKPLTLLPEFPRFLARGDRATFGAIVTNSAVDGSDAVVTIRSLDTDILSFGESNRVQRIARGDTAPVSFDAVARGSGNARVQMTVTLSGVTDAFETTLPVIVPSRLETVAAYGETTSRALERITLPAGFAPDAGGLHVELASTALVGLGESARFLDEYPYACAEQKTSRALALLLTADLGGAFNLKDIAPANARTEAGRLLEELYAYQCGDGGFTLWAGECRASNAYLTAYVLHAFRVAGTLNMTIDQRSMNRALNYLEGQLRQPPPEVQWWPAWAASQAYAVKVLAEFGRAPTADITRLFGMLERLPVFATSYLADALAASGDRGARYQAVVQRLTNALRVDADRAHVEEIDDSALVWLWNSNVRATSVVLDGLARRGDNTNFEAPLVRWLMGARSNGRWGTTQENATALEALVAYYRAFETEVPDMRASVAIGTGQIGAATFQGRSTKAQTFDLPMADLVQAVAGATGRDLTVTRDGTGRVFYTTRMQYLAPEPPTPVDRGIRVERRYERANIGETSAPGTEFSADDLVRVTLSITLPREGRYIALTDLMPAAFEPIDAALRTTAGDLAAQATVQDSASNWLTWWRRGGFDHVENHDDRVVAFATRLAAGRHEFSYLVRATTKGTFTAPGAQAEEMYAPEVKGRSAATMIQVR